MDAKGGEGWRDGEWEGRGVWGVRKLELGRKGSGLKPRIEYNSILIAQLGPVQLGPGLIRR